MAIIQSSLDPAFHRRTNSRAPRRQAVRHASSPAALRMSHQRLALDVIFSPFAARAR
jgi:hypothetical protein